MKDNIKTILKTFKEMGFGMWTMFRIGPRGGFLFNTVGKLGISFVCRS